MPTTSNFGWTTPADTDLVKDGAAAIRTLGNGIDTSFIDLKGGTTGQVLSKASNTDLDFSWVAGGDITEVQAGTGISIASGTGPIPVITNTVATAYDAKGDLIVGTGADTFSKLTVGATDGHLLTIDSSTATGLKWAAAPGGGKIAQVIYAAYTTQTDITSTSYTDTGLSASITPSATTSKVLVMVGASAYAEASGTSIKAYAQLVRGATSVRDYAAVYGFSMPNTTGTPRIHSVAPLFYLDSPSTTSSTTYKVQGRVNVVGPTLSCQSEGNPSIMILMEVLA